MRKPLNTILFILAAVLLVPIASYAAGLGPLTVRSPLGQPLDAELEVLSLRAGEETFQVRLSSRDAYRDAGMDLSPALAGVRFAVEKRDGRTIIRIRTMQPVNDPYLNLLVELHFPTGRLARQYTVLVDPAEYKVASTPPPMASAPAPTSVPVPTALTRSAPEVDAKTPTTPQAAPRASIASTPVAVAPAQVPAPSVEPAAPMAPIAAPAPAPVAAPIAATVPVDAPRSASAPAAVAPQETASTLTSSAPIALTASPAPIAAAPSTVPAAAATPAVPTAPSSAAAPAAAAAPVATPASTAATVAAEAYRIKRGDTLGVIARKWKPDGVTMHQMMIGLYQINPDAFIRENINLIRAGATLFIPGREEVLAIREEEAARQVRRQMADFSKYRRTYAAGAGGSGMSAQAQRDMVSRRPAGKKPTRSM